MKGKVKITLGVVALCIMMTGCYKNPPSCSCAEKYPQMDEPYAPSWFTVSWSDFNPLIKVQQYLCYHDSTLREHDGDTIMLYGYVNKVNKPVVGDWRLPLVPATWEEMGKDAFTCHYCFGQLMVICPNPVEEWMTESDRLIYVKGTIEYHRNAVIVVGDTARHASCVINAIQLDSVRF